ncbi:GNAT family N-acetyltransferase [Carnobacterium divergens]|uniref:GNAT family N-acetyltransferase n=1 Tax=Carnobacterium divergens TaxID=2748 RepID=UPI0039B12676
MDTTIKSMDCLSNETQEEIAMIFSNSFYSLYKSFAKDEHQLAKVLKGSFQANWLVAYKNNEPIGLLSYSDNQNRAICLNKKTIRKELGLIKGSIVYSILAKEFHQPLNYADDVGYIEFIATLPEARGQKVAQRLITHLFDQKKYSKYILEVGDTNEIAVNLYKKMGFKEFERKVDMNSKQTGFNERIYMENSPY